MNEKDTEKVELFEGNEDDGEKRRQEEEELKKMKEKQAMLGNLYVLICMVIIVAGAVIIVLRGCPLITLAGFGPSQTPPSPLYANVINGQLYR